MCNCQRLADCIKWDINSSIIANLPYLIFQLFLKLNEIIIFNTFFRKLYIHLNTNFKLSRHIR